MADQGKHIVDQLQKSWQTRMGITCLIFALALSIFISAIIYRLAGAGWIWIPIVMIGSSVVSYFLLYRKITMKDVSSYVDKSLPLAEESSSLFLKQGALNYFERRQADKISIQLRDNITIPPRIVKQQRLAVGSLLAAMMIMLALYFVPTAIVSGDNGKAIDRVSVTDEKRLPGISQAVITITPPAYTGRTSRQQGIFNIEAEESGVVQWRINTNMAADSLLLIFNDSSIIRLTPSTDMRSWRVSMPVRKPGFYQVKLGNAISDFYRIDMIADQVPEISVRNPAANSVIEPGMAYRSMVDVSLTDDYGLSATSLIATIASGSGESVAFREQRLTFSDFVPGRRAVHLKKQLDLLQLKMAPGDEIYFYISAIDNRNQEKRSDVFIVRIEDTTELMSLEGLASGIDLKPEFFRSQRQIIIETEQLLKDQPNMSKEAFTNKSNDLGIDQRLLRLRYGKFLGEETDAEIGGDDHGDEEHEEGNVGDMMDKYTHKHDNAEDATFFDPETKKQLKATLAEMWKAELQLRTIKPREALPFEYKALRLLKDLQQKTRAYVSKTGIKTTPLDPKKRLTADLSGIQQAVTFTTTNSAEENLTVIRQSLGILEQLRNMEKLSPAASQTLQMAMGQLRENAAEQPGLYLPALTSVNKILIQEFKSSDLEIAGAGLMKLAGSTKLAPVKTKQGQDGNLSDKYFKKIAGIND